MKVTMYWYGGSSYAVPDVHDESGRHAEVFCSLAAAKREFISRASSHYYPGVSECEPADGGPEAHIFAGKSRKHPVIGEEYPDMIMRFGPRGGVRVEPTTPGGNSRHE